MSCSKIWSFKLQEGSVNANVFVEYLDQLFNDLTTSGISRCLLVMDNVRFHKTDVVMAKINSSGHKVLFLPPYSPFLNPIEEVFNQMKCIVKNTHPQNKQQLMDAIMNTPSYISPQQCLNYCNHAETYFTRCISSEIIEN